eukprot:875204-Pleurochrysis_carterae.AAC.2
MARTAAMMPSKPKPVKIALRSFPLECTPLSLRARLGHPPPQGRGASCQSSRSGHLEAAASRAQEKYVV